MTQYEHERKDTRRHQPDMGRADQPYMDSSVSSLRIENMELRRKIDDLETQTTEMQQKHLKEASDLCMNDSSSLLWLSQKRESLAEKRKVF